MLPGPTIVRECAECKHMVAQTTLATGNTIGARWWTDGRMRAHMLPQEARIVKCPFCGYVQWQEDMKRLGSYRTYLPLGALGDSDGLDREQEPFEDARPLQQPNFEDLRRLLAESALDRDRERHARLWLWWRGNDRRRHLERDATTPVEPIEEENMRALLGFLDEPNQYERCLRAELQRELGCFSEAIVELSAVDYPELKPLADAIRNGAQERARTVAAIGPKQDAW